MNEIIIFCAKYLIFIIAVAGFAFWLTVSKKLKIQLAASIILAAVIAYAFVKVGGKLYYHPRPFIVENIQPLVSHGNDNSFPSEHATFSMVVATTIYFYKKQLGYILFILALLVAYGRVGAHVHYPVDVFAGLIFGAVAAKIAYDLAVQKLPIEKSTKQPGK